MTSKKQVRICDIAKALPVNQWLDRATFSELTGISKISSKRRLQILRDDGYLSVKLVGRSYHYLMTPVMQNLMIERYKTGVKSNREKVAKYFEGKKEQANKSNDAYDVLRSVKFI